LLHVTAKGDLKEHVEADVDDARVQEDGDDKPPPLVGLRLSVNVWVGWVGVGYAAETAGFAEGAFGVEGGCVRALEEYLNRAVGDIAGIPHAGNITSAHVY